MISKCRRGEWWRISLAVAVLAALGLTSACGDDVAAAGPVLGPQYDADGSAAGGDGVATTDGGVAGTDVVSTDSGGSETGGGDTGGGDTGGNDPDINAPVDVAPSDGGATDVDDGCLSADDCPDLGVPCELSVCQPDGTCAVVALDDNADCDDGSACTDQDVCKGGACPGSTTLLVNERSPPRNLPRRGIWVAFGDA